MRRYAALHLARLLPFLWHIFLVEDFKKIALPVSLLVVITMRTGKQSDMFRMPKAAEPLISGFSVAFTR
ncbi:MAG: hypothetical protein M0Z50_14745, partial [Planctomycetia bacterium]|nr:hypothetical protein [Planctomycetia bacterium]